MRDSAIELSARAKQCDLIDQAARLVGKSRNDFILEAACARARDLLLDQVDFRLSAAEFLQLTAWLNSPIEPNAGLDRLRKVKPPYPHQEG